ncbi:ATP-binding protein [Paenibacillus glycanilyticus]|uniref:histidine kinase n=1 Tax=Paenibacillus glycanilyticus TaxID=126569 RepID=A0ABQ6G9X0_9BACL|nr:ATP-binding protein [Paenibacillus glycanilyticus]GLX66366.1 hypothetical protein MU1_07100 [Paenibacillus glycanilyticus]
MKQKQAYLWITASTVVLVIILKSISWMTPDLVNIALIFLLPVILSAMYGGKWPSFYAAGIGVLAFDFFFVPPFISFSVEDIRYLFSFVIFLIVAALTASLAAQLKQQLQFARQREAYTASLYEISKEIGAITDLHLLLENVSLKVSRTVHAQTAFCLPNQKNELEIAAHSPESSKLGQSEMVISEWVYRNGKMAGRGTDVLRESQGLYIPLQAEDRTYGVLAVILEDSELSDETLRWLEALGGLAASAIARVKLSEEAKLAHLTAESERLRTAILDSVSHELRTPLATVIGSATAMIEEDGLFSPEDKHDLLITIRDGALRMNRLVSNLLGMVQLESGMLRLRKRWCDVEDIIGVVLKQVKDYQQHRKIRVRLPEQMPLILGDEVLLEQVLVNVVSNSIKYSPDFSEIIIEAQVGGATVSLSVADAGIGLEETDGERIFDKFYRADQTKHVPGTGLGLAICKGIVELHGGTISAKPNPERGTIITISLPLNEAEEDWKTI